MLWAVAGKRPTLANVGAAGLCIVGHQARVAHRPGSLAFEFGDAMTLLCAVFFAAQIIAISRYSERFNVFALTVYQFLFGGLMGFVVGALTEPAPNLAALTPEFAFNLFYLVVFASGLGYLFQNVGLAHVSPAQGSLLLSLESVFGVLASVLFYGEVITGRMAAGFVLIFAAILISELAPALGKAREATGGERTARHPGIAQRPDSQRGRRRLRCEPLGNERESDTGGNADEKNRSVAGGEQTALDKRGRLSRGPVASRLHSCGQTIGPAKEPYEHRHHGSP